jgi:hypothetical protein
LAVLVIVWLWPALLSLDPRRSAAPTVEDDVRQYVVPFGKQGTARREVGDEEWVDAAQAYIQQGAVRVGVARDRFRRLRVDFRRVSDRHAGDGESGPRRLVVRLRIIQVRNGPSVSYRSWGTVGADGPGPRLLERQGRVYKPVGAGSDAELAAQGSVELQPGKPIIDVLVFEAPTKREELRLELPASAYGQTGTLRFRIPAAGPTQQERE